MLYCECGSSTVLQTSRVLQMRCYVYDGEGLTRRQRTGNTEARSRCWPDEGYGCVCGDRFTFDFDRGSHICAVHARRLLQSKLHVSPVSGTCCPVTGLFKTTGTFSSCSMLAAVINSWHGQRRRCMRRKRRQGIK